MAIRKKKKTVTKVDRLFEIFCGETIQVMTELESEQTKSTETMVETLKAPIIVAGYLIDVDENYLYLGYDPETVNQAVRRASVVHIEILENPLDEIMNGMGAPKSGGDFN